MNIDRECRICFELENNEYIFISPCDCKGTSKYVHLECLQKWRKLNRGRYAYDRCMECTKEYLIRKKYKNENFIFKIKTRDQLYLPYILVIPFGFILTYYDSNLNILYFMDLGRESVNINMCSLSRGDRVNNCYNTNLREILKNSYFFFYFFYFGFLLFIQFFFLLLKYFYNIHKKIKRKKEFIRNSFHFHITSLLFLIKFPLLYNIFVNILLLPYVFLGLLVVLNLFEFFYYLLFYNIHNNLINKLNGILNPYTILSYEINPLIENKIDISEKTYEI